MHTISHDLLPDYLEYFAPDFSLHPDIVGKQENLNTKLVSIRWLKLMNIHCVVLNVF